MDLSKDASKNTEPMDEELKDKAPETPETETGTGNRSSSPGTGAHCGGKTPGTAFGTQ